MQKRFFKEKEQPVEHTEEIPLPPLIESKSDEQSA
jgi:hypothetical protein